VLFFAILIASVGLNVNSTAVIIGAMLISPLMGPIVGLGYGAAVADTTLMRKSAVVLLGFTVVSLATSVLYFTLSPLDEPGSELMARTSPNLWDVLIAAFGGAAGMVAATRRSFTNIAPGVAIATALMPPLCTVGFGIAHQRWDMAVGAGYLFVINSLFIASATLVVGRLLRLPRVEQLSHQTLRAHRWVLGLSLVVVVVPSVWLGVRFAQQEYFKAAAIAALRDLGEPAHVVRTDLDVQARRIDLVLVGRVNEQALRQKLLAGLSARRVHDASVTISRPDAAMWAEQQQRAGQRDESLRLLLGQVRDLQNQIHQLQEAQKATEQLLADQSAHAAKATPHHANHNTTHPRGK
jgi:uncharacterized hydrophobic protein (TIGR00271 family)